MSGVWRVRLYAVGLPAVLIAALFIWFLSSVSTLAVSYTVPEGFGLALHFIFIQHWFVALPSAVALTGGMHLLVTAVLRRHRLVNLGTAVLLAWVVIGLIVVLSLKGHLVR